MPPRINRSNSPGDERRRREILRQDAFRAQKREYIQQRKENLSRLYNEDSIVDYWLLRRDWYDPAEGLLPNPYDGPKLLTSCSMHGSDSYVLEDLSKYINSIIKTRTGKHVDTLLQNKSWLKSDLRYFGDDEMVFEGNTGAQYLQDIYKRKDYIKQHSDPELWRQYVVAVRYLSKVRTLRRLVDNRNPGLDSEPQPDGKNIQNKHLRAAWVLHRAWIRALHYRSLTIDKEAIGFQQIRQILLLATYFLAFECDNNGFQPVEQQETPEEFTGFAFYYTQIGEALNNIGDEIINEARPQTLVQRYSVEDTIRCTISPERVSQIFRKHFDAINMEWILWADLWKWSERFERAHDSEHVEDCLINKRIVFPDELSELIDQVRQNDEDWLPVNILDLPAFGKAADYEDTLDVTLTKLSQVNRLRQSYLALRDWMKRRPWKQLYLIYDTRKGATNEVLISHIQALRHSFNSLKAQYPIPPGQQIPTNKANMFSSLFPIHPIANTDFPNFKHLSDGCVICIEQFAETTGQIMLQLHCGHLFHFLCIRSAWDDDSSTNLHGAKCPTCRSSGSEWNLHTLAGITPECLNVWDYELHFEAEYTDALSNDYKKHEQTLLKNSYLFGPEYPGYPQDPTKDGEDMLRSPEVEMAVVRWVRRKLDREKRNHIARMGNSVQSLDKGFVKPEAMAHAMMTDYGPGEDEELDTNMA